VGVFERFGFFMADSFYGEISQNIVHHITSESTAEFDITLQRCHEWTIEDNLLNGNVFGSIELERTTSCNIANNSMNRGIFFESYNTVDYSSHSIDSNTVQGRQLGYFNSLNNLVLSGSNFGQIILVYCDNVEVDGGTFSNVASTITIDSCENVSIKNLSLENSFHGINVRYTTNIVIQNCVIESSRGNGVYLYHSNDLSLIGVQVSSTSTGISQWGRGIYGTGCDNLTISQSTLTNNMPYGIYLNSVTDSTLTNIDADGNYWCDISLSSCLRLTLSECDLESGIILWGESVTAWNHIFNNVMVGDLPFGYFKNSYGSTIDGSEFGQIVIVDSGNVQVTGARMSGVARGVSVVFSNNCSVVDCEISANERGCYIYQSQYCILDNIEVTKARSTIGLGTQAGLVIYSSNNSIVRNCQASNLFVGFQISDSHFINVTSCQILSNSHGFLLSSSKHCNIIQNKIYHNRRGLGVTSNYTVIIDNEFWNQTNVQATDSGWYNTWDNGIDTGNAWSDYIGTGVYFIEGTANATDRYPRLFVPPLFPEGLVEIVPIIIGIAVVTSIVTISVIVIRKRKSP
jgi:parallel beta-helix repeat protein